MQLWWFSKTKNSTVILINCIVLHNDQIIIVLLLWPFLIVLTHLRMRVCDIKWRFRISECDLVIFSWCLTSECHRITAEHLSFSRSGCSKSFKLYSPKDPPNGSAFPPFHPGTMLDRDVGWVCFKPRILLWLSQTSGENLKSTAPLEIY